MFTGIITDIGEVVSVDQRGDRRFAIATSYDPAKKKYINIWIDSMSTTPMISEGAYDKPTKTLTLVGNMQMPDGKSMKVTLITVYKDANTRTFTLSGAGPDGKDLEMIHITYKRRAK